MKSGLPLLLSLLLVARMLAAVPAGPMPAPVEAAARMRSAPAAGWVVERPYDTGPSPEERVQGYGSEYLLVDRQARGGGEPAYYDRIVARVLTADGVDSFGELTVAFHPAYQTLFWHRLQVVREGRTIDQLDTTKMRLLQRETELESRIYDGAVSAVAVLEDLRPGDIVDYAYTIEGENPIMGGRLSVEYYPASDKPVRHYAVRVLSPADRPLVVRTAAAAVEPLLSGERRPAAPAVKTVGTRDGREYLWEGRELDGVETEEEAPGWFDAYPEIEFSEYRDWAAVVDWARRIYEPEATLPPELEVRLADWKRDGGPGAEAAVRFVQDEIRYFAIAAGESSHRPNPPAIVYTRRFGDCKDKTILTVALLRRLGIEAWPALVNSNGGPRIARRLPSPYVFDHVIVAFQLDGVLHWVDPTIQRQGGRLGERAVPPYDQALLVRDGETRLTPIPRAAYAGPLCTVKERFRLSGDDSAARLEVETVFLGPSADDERDLLARTNRQKLARDFLNFYARHLPGVELAAEPTWSDDRLANRVVVRESYLVHDAWKTTGDQPGRSIEFAAHEIADHVKKPRTLRRGTPLALGWPVHLRQIVEATLVDGWSIEPEKHGTESEFIAFNRTVAVDGKRLTLDFSFRTKTDAVPPAAMRAHLKTLDEIDERLSYSVELAPVEPVRRPPRKH